MAPLTVRVPASSANLGPGYDAFGLALGIHATFSAELAEEWSVRVVGEGSSELPADTGSPVVQAMKRVFRECGSELAARVFCHNRIPIGKGLGSSAAAIVGGCVLGDALCTVPLGSDALFGVAAELEGHADNVGAALFGGLTIAYIDEVGLRCARMEPPGVAAVVLASAGAQSTKAARASLPEAVPHADAAFNAGRAGLLTAGLLLGRPDLVRSGAADRLHEPYRSSLPRTAPEARRVMLEAGADGVVVSGSGPSLVGLIADVNDRTAMHRANVTVKRLSRALRDAPGWAEPIAVPIDREGAVIVER